MHPIYIEASDEITTVIERLKNAEEKALALVVPKEAILLQSIVNLKLAKRAAADAGKELTLVTTDKIGRNLANQIGLPVISKLGEEMASPAEGTESKSQDSLVIDGVKVHRYYDDQPEEESPIVVPEKPEPNPEPTPEPVTIKEETPPEVVEEPEETPIVIRKIALTEPLPSVKKAPAVEEKNTPSKPAVVELIKPQPTSKITRTAITAKSDTRKPRRFKKVLAFLLYLLLLAIIGGGAASAFYLPKTNLVIFVKPQAFSQDTPVSAKVGTTEASDTVPAQYISADVTTTLDFNSTGTKDVGTTASGTAQIFNQYSTSPTLPAGTLIVANGINFVTTQQVAIPPVTILPSSNGPQPINGTFTVSITAQNPGETGNMSSVPGSVPQTNLTARIVSTTGGTSKTVAVVSATDVANAKAALTNKLHEDSTRQLDVEAKSNPNNLFSANKDQYSLTNYTLTADVNSEASKFTISGKATNKRLIIDRSTVENLIQTKLQSSHDASHTLNIENIDVQNLQVDTTANSATLTAHATGNIVPIVATDNLVGQIVGKNLTDAENLIKVSIKETDRFEVTRTPAWWPLKNFPFSKKYITIHE